MVRKSEREQEKLSDAQEYMEKNKDVLTAYNKAVDMVRKGYFSRIITEKAGNAVMSRIL